MRKFSTQELNNMILIRTPCCYLCSVGLADAMQTVEFAAGLTAWHHARLHVAAGEVLQLVVNVEVPDAAMETGHIWGLRREAKGGRHHLLRHTWTGRRVISHSSVQFFMNPWSENS